MFEPPLRRVVLLAVLALLAAAMLAPVLAELSSAAAVPLYAAFSWVCHQRPQRTWHVGAYPLAVCVRCLGLYAGAAAGAVVGLPFSRRFFLASMALLAAEWLVEASGWAAPPAPARFAAGLLAGFFLAPALWGEHCESSIRIEGMRGEVNT